MSNPKVKRGSESWRVTEGVSTLMYNCQQEDVPQVKQIIQRKPSSIRERDRTGKIALHYCAENATINCTEMLLKSDPAVVNMTDEEGYTPLHLAVIAGNKVIIRHLLSRGADVNIVDSELHSVVHWATVCGELDALEMVLEAGAEPCTADLHGAYPLHYAAQMCGQKKSTSTQLLRDGKTGLAALKKLISRGAAVDLGDRDGRQPLLWAASSVLVHVEAPPSKDSSPTSGSSDAILALVNAGASVAAADKDGLTALHCAASRGHSDCLETLVALCGADVDMVDCNGCTALFYAVTLGHADCAQLLLNYGANPNHQDKKGRTPAYCGASKGQMETLKLLCHHGGDVWLRSTKGDTALHEAVGSGRKELLLWLLRQRNHAANLANKDGRCPLHVAAINNNVEMCKILIDHDADINCIMRSSRGQLITPLDAALRRGNRDCAKFLVLHGGLPAAKLTDSRALSKALNQVFSDSQRSHPSLSHNGDYPSLSDSQMSTMSSVLHAPHFNNKSMLQSFSRLEDSSTQTQLEESFFSESKDAQIQLTSADLRRADTESSLRRRRIRRRARRSLTETRPPPNDQELRWKSRQRNSYPNDSDSGSEDEEQAYNRFYGNGQTDPLQKELDQSSKPKHPEEYGNHHIIQVQLEKEERNADGNNTALSVMSNVGTESSGQKDSGFSDVLGTRVSECEPFTDEEAASRKQNSPDRDASTGVLSERLSNHSTSPEYSIEKLTINNQVNVTPIEITGQQVNPKENNHKNHWTGNNSTTNQTITTKPHLDEQAEHARNKSQWTSGGSSTSNHQTNSIINSQSERVNDDRKYHWISSSTTNKTINSQPEQVEQRTRIKNPGWTHHDKGTTNNQTGIIAQNYVADEVDQSSTITRMKATSQSFRNPRQTDNSSKKSFNLRRSKSVRVTNRQPDQTVQSFPNNFKTDIVSVTRATQMKNRKYNLERKLFQQLLELKQMQIRSGLANEQVFAKRLIESFRKDAVTVGLRPFDGPYSFKDLETYLYYQLRLVQGGHHAVYLPSVDGEPKSPGAVNVESQSYGTKISTNHTANQCTNATYRCPHAMYAYTGIPCAAYIPYHRHNQKLDTGRTILPKLHNNINDGRVITSNEGDE